MKLKDFHVGQTVYVVGGDHKQERVVSEYHVVSVGRKYIKCENDIGNIREFEILIDEQPYLTEHKDYGYKKLLFSTEKAASEHVEGNALRSWLSKAAEWYKLNQYTIEQLRTVKEILAPDIQKSE